jgi:hypothetical protein
MRNSADRTGGKPIAVLLRSISGVSAINPLVAFYDIHGGKTEVLFFYFVPDTTRDIMSLYNYEIYHFSTKLRVSLPPIVKEGGAPSLTIGRYCGRMTITRHFK